MSAEYDLTFVIKMVNKKKEIRLFPTELNSYEKKIMIPHYLSMRKVAWMRSL